MQYQKRIRKNNLVKKTITGDLSPEKAKKIPVYLQNQIRGIIDEKNACLKYNQMQVEIRKKNYSIIGAIDGLEQNIIIEFKSRKKYFCSVIRDKIQLMVYCIALEKDGILREKLNNQMKDTFYSYTTMLQFWKLCIPILDASILEFRNILKGIVNHGQKQEIHYWLLNSHH